MNVAVQVHGCQSSGGGSILLTIHICTSAGHDIGTDVPVDFAASTTVMARNITDRARRALVDMNIPGASTATYRLFGGPM